MGFSAKKLIEHSDIAILFVIVISILSSAFYAVSWLFVCASSVLGCLGLIIYPSRWKRTTTLLATCFVAYNVITIVPLTRKVEKILGDKYETQNTEVRTTIAEAKKLKLTDDILPIFSLSRNQPGTMRMILLVIAGFSMAGVASRLSKEGAVKCLKLIALIGIIIALIGYIGQWIWPQQRNILWFIPVEHGKPVACFINRNHFGGFIAMLAPACALIASNAVPRKTIIKTLLWNAAFVMLTIAIVMSLSRGAMISYVGGIIVIIIISIIKRRWSWGILMTLFVAIAVTAGLCLKEPSAIERLESFTMPENESSMKMRFETWRASVKILQDYTITGTGANAFSMVFPQYRTAPTRKSFKHAENEYLQWMVEYGVIGTLILAGLIFSFIMDWRKKTIGAANELIQYSVAGAFVSTAIHAGLDFALRVPIYFVTLCILAGIVISNNSSDTNTMTNEQFCEFKFKLRKLQTVFPVFGLVLTLIISTVYNHISQYEKSDFLIDASSAQLCRALVYCPVSWQAWYHLGRRALEEQNEETMKFGEKCIVKATEYDPLNYRVWIELAKVRASHGDIAGAKHAYSKAKELRGWIKIKELE